MNLGVSLKQNIEPKQTRNVYDIQEQDGILVINLSGESKDKSIKTHVGNRLVPLHPKLLKLAFSDYVKKIKSRNEQKLFLNLNKI